jgi:hypothetical protein
MADVAKWNALHPLVIEARDLLYERFDADPNVVLMAFGPPIRNGRALDTPALIVGVVRKLPESELAPDQVIPRTVEVRGVQVETDVIETGEFRAH